MREEERIMKGVLFSPADPELKEIKRRAHHLSQRYSQTFEEQTEERQQILQELLGEMGDRGFMQGPVFFIMARILGSAITFRELQPDHTR